MDDGRCLANAVAPRYVDRIGVAVPHKLHGRERMVPTEIHAADARPMPRKVARLAGDDLLRNREDATGAKCRHALRARLALMRRVARDDLGLLLGAEMTDIIDRHGGDAAIRRRFE